MNRKFPAGVATGKLVKEILDYAKEKQFAIPACNVIGSSNINAALETAARLNAPMIIQFSNGGSIFNAGKALKPGNQRADVLGAIAGAKHIHTLAEAYGATVILHTDHCAKKLLPWIDGLLLANEEFYKSEGKTLYSSHMLDLSEQPLDENLDISYEYFKRMAKMEMTIEVEIGITGGEEDGVDNSHIDSSKLYTQPEDIYKTYKKLNSVSPNFTIAAAFGNVHGVYKPGNVKLEPKILRDSQQYVQNQIGGSSKPINFVFHGGSGSSQTEIQEAISYGVIKMNIDTDLQFAYSEGARDYMETNIEYLRSQVGNPSGADAPNKKYYDPRVWVRKCEESFSKRLEQSFKDLNNINTL